jgi:predicted nucleic acid-binding protein
MIVVDASVVMKWFAPEELAEEADRLQPVADRLVAPDFLLTEVAQVAWLKQRRGELATADASRIVSQLRCSGLQLVPSELLLEDAFALAVRLDHGIYGCLYAAAAERLDARLITWDKPFFHKLSATPLAAKAYLLADVGRLLVDLGVATGGNDNPRA